MHTDTREETNPRYSKSFRAEVRALLARHAIADNRRALLSLTSTLVLYLFCLWVGPLAFEGSRSAIAGIDLQRPIASARAVARAAALLLLLAGVVLTQGGLYIRTFMINHDLLHGCFFTSQRANRLVALLSGTLCNTTPSVWKREHDRHHTDSNQLDTNQDGQTASWTLEQYLSASPAERFGYYLLNLRWTLFTLIPIGYFLGFMRIRARWYENLLVAMFFAGLAWTDRLGYFLITFSLTAPVGFLLFHMQHTFDGVYKRRGDAWDFFDNGMLGSSFLQLPEGRLLGPVLRFFAFGVQYHHVHHLHPGIPGYEIARCHEEGEPLFRDCPRVDLRSGLKTLGYSLYDEQTGRFEDVAHHPPFASCVARSSAAQSTERPRR